MHMNNLNNVLVFLFQKFYQKSTTYFTKQYWVSKCFVIFSSCFGRGKNIQLCKEKYVHIPSSDLAVVDGKLSRIECTLLCGYEMACQTFFYKPNDRSCSIYKYPLLNNTPVSIESGVEVFEIKGKLNTFGTLWRVLLPKSYIFLWGVILINIILTGYRKFYVLKYVLKPIEDNTYHRMSYHFFKGKDQVPSFF